MHGRVSATPGGARLRALREQKGKTQLWVEAEAELGTGYMQRVESGRVAQPERQTVERMLTALGARYTERQEILEAFGYTVTAPEPDEADFAWARATSRPALDGVMFPAYALDCTHRLVAWNRFVPRVFALSPEDPTLGGLAGQSILVAWFNPASPLAALVAEPEAFLPALVRAMRYEMLHFRHEPWYTACIAPLDDLERFRHYRAVVEAQPAPPSATRALVPVRLAVPGVGALQFRLSSEPFVQDARFRLIYYFPADPDTMRRCAAWAVEG